MAHCDSFIAQTKTAENVILKMFLKKSLSEDDGFQFLATEKRVSLLRESDYIISL